MSGHGDQDNRPWKFLSIVLALFLGFTAQHSWRLTSGIDEASLLLGVRQASAAEKKAADTAKKKASDAAIAALSRIKDYDAARWHPIHFKPAIDAASNEQCLVCHQEILKHNVRPASPAGVKAAEATAWYQTLDTYTGDQTSFHARHLTSPFAKQVMNLSCNFCHQGHDIREEAPGSSATTTVAATGNYTLRKQVDPQSTCLLCHGRFPVEFMEGLDQPWHKIRENFETPEAPNGCLTCHEQMFRTVRHQVNYLNATGIEQAAKTSSDTCFGCHGGRAWYRTTFPYPRHPWPDMPKDVPAWAKDRPTKSDPRHTAGMAK